MSAGTVTGTAASGAETAATGKASDATAAITGASESTSDDIPDSLDGLKEALRKARKEARDGSRAATERDSLQAKLKAIDEAQLTESQKAVQRAEAAEAELSTLRVQVQRQDAEKQFRSLVPNAVYPDALWKLAADAVDFDAKGKPTNLTDVVKTLQTEYPALFGKLNGNGDGGGGTKQRQGGASGTDMNSIIRRTARPG